MPITFEQVSYSYNPPKKYRSKKAAEAKAPANLSSDSALSSADSSGVSSANKADWGNAPDSVWALRDISFTLSDGEFFGVAGHTGSGKSTLIQHMNGLVNPVCGTVLVDGMDIADKRNAAVVRGKIGLVFQYPEYQLFAATVYEDVAFGPRNLGLSDVEVDQRVRESLEQVSLDFDELQSKSPFELSGGQQRRVAFAGVLAMRPSVLVLDEPVAGLDPVTRKEFLEFIANLHRDGLTVVMVSHSMNDLARLCDRVLVLKEGALYMLGTPDEVFTRGEELSAIGLSAPSAQRLADQLREEGVSLGSHLYDPETLADDLGKLYFSLHPKQES